MMSQEDMIYNFRRGCTVYRTELILLYAILRLIINIIDWLFLNSVQKSQWAHMSISPRVEVGGSKDCPLLKYCNVQKLGSWFTLGLDAAENTCYKYFKWRKLRSRALLMFSNEFQELSVSTSAVNFFKVTNLCKNGIHICEIWRDARFLVQNLAEFYFSLKFYDESKIRTIVPKYFHSRP